MKKVNKFHIGRYIMVIIIAIITVNLFNSCNNTPPKTTNNKRKLVVWQTETDKGAINVLNEVIKKFEEKYNVDVSLESIPWNSLSAKLALAIQSNSLPDVAHLEPFMAYSLKSYLWDINDVISNIEKENNDTIMDCVKNLQLYEDNKRYGIAYAVGTTGYGYRKDIADKLHLTTPKNWDELLIFIKKLSKYTNGDLKVLLPGADPFFVDQLYGELLANNNGKLFNTKNYKPLLDSKESIEVLEFFNKLKPFIQDDWLTQKYLDQFNRLGNGKAILVPVTYVRAAKSIEKTIGENNDNNKLKPNPSYFGLMPQPIGWSSKGKSISTIDCEPYVIFKKKGNNGKIDTSIYLAKKFLEFFYLKDNYLKFVEQVPIHLTPIFRNMSHDKNYLSQNLIVHWKDWANLTDSFLKYPDRVRPILMPDISEEGKRLPFLLEFQSSNILTEAINDVLNNHLKPNEAARKAQLKAEKLIENLGYKKW